MFIRNLFFYTGIVLAITTGIQRGLYTTLAQDEGVLATIKQEYVLKEDFESAKKGNYAAEDLVLPSGSWHLENALIGNTVADRKQGTRSVRMKDGSLSMNFDLQNIGQLYISHGLYGNDPTALLKIFVSVDGGRSYTQVGKAIQENNSMLVTDTIAVTPSLRMRFRFESKGKMKGARINIDDITFVEVARVDSLRQVTGDSLSAPSLINKESLSGKIRGLIYSSDIEPAAGDNSNMLLGNPSKASATTPENYFLDLKYYSQSYSRSKAIPNWVSWHLDARNTTGIAARMDNFAGFSGLPPDFFVATSSSYVGSGFDRGHNCPSADRSSSPEANSATFLMTNMVPQAPRNNQRTWANFEAYLRKLVDEGNELYIIMGNYGIGGTGSKGAAKTIANGNIAVPANLWKVALILPAGNNDMRRVTATTRVIAISAANINTIDPDWRKYIVSVNDIEKATGYDLFTALPERLQTILEQKKDIGY